MSTPSEPARKVIPITPVAADASSAGEIISLYEALKKIYPRSISGLFARWRWGMVLLTQLVFYGLPWYNKFITTERFRKGFDFCSVSRIDIYPLD